MLYCKLFYQPNITFTSITKVILGGLATLLELVNRQFLNLNFGKIILFFLSVLKCLKVGENVFTSEAEGLRSLYTKVMLSPSLSLSTLWSIFVTACKVTSRPSVLALHQYH